MTEQLAWLIVKTKDKTLSYREKLPERSRQYSQHGDMVRRQRWSAKQTVQFRKRWSVNRFKWQKWLERINS